MKETVIVKLNKQQEEEIEKREQHKFTVSFDIADDADRPKTKLKSIIKRCLEREGLHPGMVGLGLARVQRDEPTCSSQNTIVEDFRDIL